MENNNINLLDLGDDFLNILNIIGDYVKKDNHDRIVKEKLKQDLFNYVDIIMKEERKIHKELYGTYHMKRDHARYRIWLHFDGFYKNRFGLKYFNENYIEIKITYNKYLKSKNLYLKNQIY